MRRTGNLKKQDGVKLTDEDLEIVNGGVSVGGVIGHTTEGTVETAYHQVSDSCIYSHPASLSGTDEIRRNGRKSPGEA